MHIGTQGESLFASLSIWIIIVIPAPWNFDQWEDSLLARDLLTILIHLETLRCESEQHQQ